MSNFKSGESSRSDPRKLSSSLMTEFSRTYSIVMKLSKMDPFVAFEYEKKKFRTKVSHDGGRNPHWVEVSLINQTYLRNSTSE